MNVILVIYCIVGKKENQELDADLDEDIHTNAIKSRYLKRLSHVGIYNLYDKVEE